MVETQNAERADPRCLVRHCELHRRGPIGKNVAVRVIRAPERAVIYLMAARPVLHLHYLNVSLSTLEP